MTDDMKPCPFCGTSPFRTLYDADTKVYFVVCHGCDCEGPMSQSRIEAIAAWNRRTKETEG